MLKKIQINSEVKKKNVGPRMSEGRYQSKRFQSCGKRNKRERLVVLQEENANVRVGTTHTERQPSQGSHFYE